MSAHLKSQGFAWTLRRTVDGGGHTVTMMRISCRSCTSFIEKTRNNENQAPVPLQKWFRRQGWHLEYHKPNSAICPDCQKRPAPPQSNVVPMAPPQKPKEIIMTPTNPQPTEVHKAPDGVVSALPRHLNDSERDQLRDLLERFFVNGRYQSGYSDHIIADKLSIPRQRVIEMREIAFGKIKGDPELETLVSDVAAFRAQIQTQIATLASMETKLNNISERVQAAVKRVMP